MENNEEVLNELLDEWVDHTEEYLDTKGLFHFLINKLGLDEVGVVEGVKAPLVSSIIDNYPLWSSEHQAAYPYHEWPIGLWVSKIAWYEGYYLLPVEKIPKAVEILAKVELAVRSKQEVIH